MDNKVRDVMCCDANWLTFHRCLAAECLWVLHFLNSAFTFQSTKYPVFFSHHYIPNTFLFILFSVQNVKVHRGRKGMAPLVVSLGSRWMWVGCFISQPVYRFWILLEVIKWEVVWASEPVWGFWRRDKALGIPTRDRPARNLVAIPTTLIWLPCSLFR